VIEGLAVGPRKGFCVSGLAVLLGLAAIEGTLPFGSRLNGELACGGLLWEGRVGTIFVGS